MVYYKIIHKATGRVMCYASSEIEPNTDDITLVSSEILTILGDEYTAEQISKEEYDKEAEDLDDVEEDE